MSFKAGLERRLSQTQTVYMLEVVERISTSSGGLKAKF
jgi:hypothetical protein